MKYSSSSPFSHACTWLIAAGGLFAASLPGEAAVILSPASILGNTGGEFASPYALTNAINQSGLSTGFVSGVTDFDTYLALNPTHTLIASGYEWFTPSGVLNATVTLDLGGEYAISRLAIWNEESVGILSLNVFTSNDPTFATSTAVGLFAINDNPDNFGYPAQVLDLVDSNARYVRLGVIGVPGASYIGVGEIAFAVDSVTSSPIPEPGHSTLIAALLGSGLLARKRGKR